MKICFKTDEYLIDNIQIDTDEQDNPVDIVIRAEESVLKDIADKYAVLGINIAPIYDYVKDEFTDKLAGLYGRLDPFSLVF